MKRGKFKTHKQMRDDYYLKEDGSWSKFKIESTYYEQWVAFLQDRMDNREEQYAVEKDFIDFITTHSYVATN